MNPPGKTKGGGGRIRTILLDLDGTLLDLDMGALLDGYFPLLARRFGAEKDVASFRELLFGAVREMTGNRDASLGLDSIFLRFLSPRLGVSPEVAREEFRECHLNEFSSLRGLTRPVPAAQTLVTRAGELGYLLALATNPVFFREAIAARLSWAGLNASAFRFTSSMENMHFCKPHPGYFLEVLQNLGSKAGESLMVGNDHEKDMPAAAAGMVTFHVSLRGRPGTDSGADMAGRLQDVLPWLETLKPVI